MICAYYFVVGGWVVKYASNFIVSGDFGSDPWEYFNAFVSDPVKPLIWSMALLIFTLVLLPLGTLLTCLIVPIAWKWKNYENELTNEGKFGHISTWDKIEICVIVPFFMLVVLLNVFGVIK